MAVVNTVKDALGILIQGIKIAQKAGAYDIEEAGILAEAINFLTVPKGNQSNIPKSDAQKPNTQTSVPPPGSNQKESNEKPVNIYNDKTLNSDKVDKKKKLEDPTIPKKPTMADKVVQKK